MYTLSPQLFSQAFPFHLAFNSAFEIVQVGEALARIHPLLLGDRLDQHFQIHQPKIELQFSVIQKRSFALFLLQSRHGKLQLKGQMLYLEAESVMLFLCSVWVIDSTELPALGVKLKDFAIHDLTPDFLFLQNTSRTVIAEVKSLTEAVIEQKRMLQTALQTQAEMTRSAEAQAQQLEKTLSELQRAQAQLVQAEKMSSLGQLVAGIAHEINNPVNFIQGNVNHVQKYVNDLMDLVHLYQAEYPATPAIVRKLEEVEFEFLDEDLPKLLTSMHLGAVRINEIVKSLRIFSRLDEAEVKAVDIHDGIDSTLMILGNRLKPNGKYSGIQVVKSYGELPLVRCYAGQLNQVFVNILSNAIDALEEAVKSGKFCLKHKAEKLNCGAVQLDFDPQPTIRVSTECVDSKRVKIAIADNGLGILEQIKSRIFDPFFTTKPVGKGTGMGMSISYQIVTELHKGKLYCHSIPGRGTEFVIEIPVDQGERD